MTVQHNVVQPGILLWLEADTFWTVPQGRDISTGMENAIEDTIKKNSLGWTWAYTHTYIYKYKQGFIIIFMCYPKTGVVSWNRVSIDYDTSLWRSCPSPTATRQQPGGQRSVDEDISKVDLASMFRWLAIPKLQQKEHTTHPGAVDGNPPNLNVIWTWPSLKHWQFTLEGSSCL